MGKLRQASRQPRFKGHSQSIFTEVVQMSASVNQIKNKKEILCTSPASLSTGPLSPSTCQCHSLLDPLATPAARRIRAPTRQGRQWSCLGPLLLAIAPPGMLLLGQIHRRRRLREKEGRIRCRALTVELRSCRCEGAGPGSCLGGALPHSTREAASPRP